MVVFADTLSSHSNVKCISDQVKLGHRTVPVTSSVSMFLRITGGPGEPTYVLVSRSRFLSGTRIVRLTHVISRLTVPIVTFKLGGSFRGRLFTNSGCLLLCTSGVRRVGAVY